MLVVMCTLQLYALEIKIPGSTCVSGYSAKVRAYTYLYLHCPFTMAILTQGAALSFEMNEVKTGGPQVFTFVASSGVLLLILALLHLLTSDGYGLRSLVRTVSGVFLCAFSSAAYAPGWPLWRRDVTCIAVVTSVYVLQVILDMVPLVSGRYPQTEIKPTFANTPAVTDTPIKPDQLRVHIQDGNTYSDPPIADRRGWWSTDAPRGTLAPTADSWIENRTRASRTEVAS